MLEMKRRQFLQTLGGGFLVMLTAERDLVAQESGARERRMPHELPPNVAAWLHIAPDGKITAFTGKVEVGQNIRTSLTQAVADELHCSPASVNLIMGDTVDVSVGYGHLRQPHDADNGARNAQDGGHGSRSTHLRRGEKLEHLAGQAARPGRLRSQRQQARGLRRTRRQNRLGQCSRQRRSRHCARALGSCRYRRSRKSTPANLLPASINMSPI